MFSTPFSFLAAPAGGGGWAPSDLPNLYDWWNPSTGVSLSGSNVLTWTGYNGTVLSPYTGGNYATFSASDAAWNSQPSILINPTNAGGEWSYVNTSLTTSVSSKTIIGVAKMITLSDEKSFIYLSSTVGARFSTLFRTAGGNTLWGYTDGLPNASYSTLGVSDVDGSYLFSLNEYYVDGSAINYYASNTSTLGTVQKTVTGRTANFNGFDVINLGGYTPVATLGCCKFSVVELIYVAGILSEGDLSSLETYLASKYAL